MWPREGARKVTGPGESAEGRARRRRSGGSRGHSGSGDRVARLDQQAARGAIGVHKKEFRRLWGWGRRLREVHTGRTNGGTAVARGGCACARATAGAGL
jgi:hypothetical protein